MKESSAKQKPTIPDVNEFIRFMDNKAFEIICQKKLVNGKENKHFNEIVFMKWLNQRSTDLLNSEFGEKIKWLQEFLIEFCKQLNDITIKIATGAHMNFKNHSKWNNLYTSGYLDLFHLLDYGNGYLNTIEDVLISLRLNWDENPLLATRMQSYCIDRIKEMKRILELNYHLKKSNPIYFYYDEIISKFKDRIDFEETKLRVENPIDLVESSNVFHVRPTPPTKKKTNIVNNINPKLYFQVQINDTNKVIDIENWNELKETLYQQKIENYHDKYEIRDIVDIELRKLSKLKTEDQELSILIKKFQNYLNEIMDKQIHIDKEKAENPYSTVFIDSKAYRIFTRLNDLYKDEENQTAHYSFIYYAMQKDKLVLCSGKKFIDFLSTLNIHIDKIDSRQYTSKTKQAAYDAIKAHICS